MMKTLNNKKLHYTYNAGVATFLELKIPVDKYNTPLKSKKEKVVVKKAWFRILGITAEEQYTSRQVDEEVIYRIAVPFNAKITSRLQVKISNVVYGIARVYHNSKNSETEISLKELK